MECEVDLDSMYSYYAAQLVCELVLQCKENSAVLEYTQHFVFCNN